MRVGRPHWSPDGTRIAFTGNRVGRPSQIYVIPAAGGSPEVVGSDAYEADVSWSPDGKSLLFARGALGGDKAQPGLYILDWQTRKTKLLEGSEMLPYAAWSPDPRYIAATGVDAKLHLFDFRTRQWSILASGIQLGFPFWSRDGKYVYFQDLLSGEDQPIFRVRISDRRVEKLASVADLPQSDVTGYSLTGLDPDNEPIATVLRTNSDVYALDLELP
jgi:Tol biopolymer transport system component